MRRGRRTAIPDSWDGPDQDAYKNHCKGCDGTGTVEDGERVEVDDYIPALCGDCDGTGVACDEEE